MIRPGNYDANSIDVDDAQQVALVRPHPGYPVRGRPGGAVTDAQIYVASVDDSDAHKLPLPAGVPYGDADWSPDGSRIVFSSYPIHEFNTGEARVMTARPDGTDVKTFNQDGAPTWTPDGKQILFWAPTTFYMMSPDGQDSHPVDELGRLNYGDTGGYGYYGWLQPPT